MQKLSRRANSLAHLDSKSQSPEPLVSSNLATAPPPAPQAQRRGSGPLPAPARAPQTPCSGFWGVQGKAQQRVAASHHMKPTIY